MKFIAIKILEYRIRKAEKKIIQYERELNTIYIRAFGDMVKSYRETILFLNSEQ